MASINNSSQIKQIVTSYLGKKLLLFILSTIFVISAQADCTLSMPANSSSNPLGGCSGIVTISSTLTMDVNYDLSASGITSIIITNTGVINWTSSVYLNLPANVPITIQPGGVLSGSPCDNASTIQFGGITTVSCDGTGNNLSFAEVMTNGGIFGPRITSSINSNTITNNNDGINDIATFSVCTSVSPNLFFSAFTDLNNAQPSALVKVSQTVIKTNVAIGITDGTNPLSAFSAPFNRTVTLVDPTMQGKLVMKFLTFLDLDNDNILDGNEFPADSMIYTVNVNPIPVLSVTINTINNTANNDGSNDYEDLSVCNSAADNLFFTLFSDLNNSGPSNFVKISQSFVRDNVVFSPSDGTFPLSDYGTPFDRNVSLINPGIQGSLEMKFVTFFDANNNNIMDAGECSGDSVIFLTVVNPLPVVDAGAYPPVCIDAADVNLTGSPSGGTFSGTGVLGNLFDPSVGTQIITYNYTDINGCSNSDTTLITVNPLPVVDAGTYLPVCIDAADVVLVGSPIGGTFSGIGVTGNLFDPSVGTQLITYTYTDGNGCSNSATATITVNPLPLVDAGAYAPVCQGSADVVLSGSPFGGSFSGIGVSGNIFDPSVGTQIITYVYSDVNGCTNSDTALLTVNPTPALSVTVNGVNVTNNNDGTNDTNSFTVCNSSVNNLFFTLFSDVNNVIPSGLVKITQQFTLTNVNFSPANGTIPLSAYGTPFDRIVSLTNPSIPGTLVMDFVAFLDLNNNNVLDGNECISDHVIYTVSVNPEPQLSITVNGANITSNSDGINDFNSFAVCNAASNNMTFTLFSDLNNLLPTNLVKISQHFDLNNVVFTPLNSTFPITVYGTPFDRNVALVNPLVGGTLIMKFVSFYDANNNNVLDGTECAGDTAVYLVTVNPLPLVNAGAYPPVCSNAADITLSGSPSGGIFTGIGVTGNVFDPSVGTQIVTYTYTDLNGCTSSDTALITVYPLPVVDAGAYSPVCIDAPDILLTGSPVGGTFSGLGVTGNTFDPSFGTQIIAYTYTNANGCTNSDTALITVYPLPVVDAGSYAPVCQGAANITLVGSPVGGTFSGLGVTGNTFDPTFGTQIVTYTYTNANGCTNSDTALITVKSTPRLGITVNGVNINNNNDGVNDIGVFAVCDSPVDNMFFTLFSDLNSATPSNLVKITQQFTLTNVSFTPPNSTFPLSVYGTPFDRNVALVNSLVAGSLVMDFVAFLDLNNNDVLDANECASDHIVYTVTVNPLPDATITAPTSVCPNSVGNAASVVNAGVGSNYNWTITNGTIVSGNGTNSIMFTADASGTITLDVTVTDPNGCTDTDSESVSIGSLPAIVCSPDVTVTNDPGECNYTGLLIHPTPTGYCVPLSLAVSFSNGIPTPSILPTGGIVVAGSSNTYDFYVGQTIVTYTVTDASLNTATCSFKVTVLDTQLPVITCPGPVVVSNTPGICGATVNFNTPLGIDNCPNAITTQTSGLASGSVFPVGVTTNTFMVTDASGNTATCSFTVNVIDTEKPVITCPGNINVNNDLSVCGATINFNTPVGTDNCPNPVTTQILGLASGSVFPVGITTNIFVVTDANGNTASCSFTVTVNDTEKPIIPLCPQSQFLNAIDPTCSALATWVIPIPTDNCGILSFTYTTAPPTPIIEISGNASGDFGVGTTVLTYLATDLYGNTATCQFSITVYDVTNPIITNCPGSVSANNTPGLCSGIAIWTAPTASDNCPGVTLVTNHNPGETFPVGNTTVTYMATDASGNTSTCSFIVTINDTELPTITCPANIIQANDLNFCSAVVNYTAPVGTDNCSGSTTTQIGGLASGSVFPFGTTVNTFRVTDASGNSSTCSFTVTIIDTQIPVITCPANIIQANDLGFCSAIVNYTSPVGTDNCPGATTTQIGGLSSGSVFPFGATVNTFRVTDASGNSSTCSFTVTVIDTELPVIVCPANITVSNDPGFCSAVVNYVAPVGTDNCPNPVTIQSGGLASGSTFMVGTTVNTFKVTDASGNTATCSFTVTVLETQLPVITCPGNIVQSTDLNLCSAIVTYVTPVGTDNCPNPVTIQTTGLPSGSAFPKGVTINTFKVTDMSGNTATCSFTVTINDNQLPSITCPANITKTNDTLMCGAIVSFTPPVGTDNCPGATTTQIGGLPTGSLFPVGVTVNTFRVTDASGNSTTCSFTVTVTDDDKPFISCPGNIVTKNDTLLCGAVVNFNPPVGTDNCPNPVTIQIGGLPSGSLFPVGTTTNIFKVTDASGNTATCSFTVKVNDTEKPILACPINIIQGNDQDVCKAWVNFLAVDGTDNCDPHIEIYYWTDGVTVYGGPDIFGQSNDNNPANDPIHGQATPNWYNVGVTNVHYFGVDDAGNISTICNFTITVKDTKIPVVTQCPISRNVFVNPGTCAGTVPNMLPEFLFTDNCLATATQTPAAGSFFGAAHNDTQVVTFTVTDQGGNTATCTATLTLKDNIAPVITTCPANRNISTNLNVCNGTVPNLIPELVWSDNCPSATVVQFPTPGKIFGTANNDTLHVIFIVTDKAGNTATCLTILTLKDVQAPTIICPANITAPCSPPLVIVPKPSVADNCTVFSVTNNYTGTGDASAIYPLGTTIVTWTVSDANANTATCTMTVTVGPLPVVSVTGQGIYCHDGFIPNLVAFGSTPGTFAWYTNASATIPVNPLQVSGPNNSVYKPTGNLGVETVYVVLTNPITGCSSIPVAATVNIVSCNIVITDPCNCKNNATNLTNGQFDETVTIFAPPSQFWYIKSVTGLYKTTSPAPPAAPTPLSIGILGSDKPVEGIPGQYVFTGLHVDALGYTITFANTLGDTLKVGNSCYYPNPVIDGLFPDYCQNHAPVTLMGNALPQLPQVQRFDLYDATNTILVLPNITQLVPAAIAPGTYTVRYTFDALDNFPSFQYPGCISTVTQQVKIFPIPPTDLVCGGLANVSLDMTGMAVIGADMILQGNYGCFSQYEVDIEGALTNKVSCDDIGKIYKVTITDPITHNKCWGNIKVEDKLKPIIQCADVTVSCNNDGLDPKATGYPIISDNCSIDTSTIKYFDIIVNTTCVGALSATITRTWNAKDKSGNPATPCTQVISIKRGTLAEVKFPPNLDDIAAPSLSCEDPNILPSNTGVPTIDGKPIEKYCELMVAPYSDVIIPICEKSFKIVRTWTVMDACSNNMITAVQIIYVKDKVGPQMACPSASAFTWTVNGNGNTCEAIVIAPDIAVQDNCSSYSNLTIKTKVNSNGIVTEKLTNGGTFHVPFGINTFTYTSTDNCGNVSTCSIDVNIQELEPPVAVCQQYTIVALTNPITYVNAASFDAGSYDDCGGPLTLTVRRMDNPNCPGDDSTPLGPQVPFFCCDVNNGPVMVVLRATDASGNFNECMVEANVVDKIKPTIICPADLTLQCGEPTDPTDPATYAIGKNSGIDISAIFANTYVDTLSVSGLPNNAKITDLNLGLDLKHEYIDQLTIKLISPAGTVLTLFQGGSCGQFKKDINATFDDQGVTFFCNGASTAITGSVKPQVSQMNYVNGENPNGKWKLQVSDNAPLGGGKINSFKLYFTYATPLAIKPVVTDNTSDCGLTVTWKDLNDPGQCLGNSFINRRWTVSDQSANSKTCVQKINLKDNTPLDIDFPDDVTITDCVALDSLTGLGSIKHTGDCEIVAVEYTDEVFNVVPDACYKIIRTWKVLDWCKYDPAAPHTDGGIDVDFKKYDFNPNDNVVNNEFDNNHKIIRDDGDGYFSVKQVIKIIDKDPPKFNSCPKDTVLCSFATDCANNPITITRLATDACAPANQLKYSWKLDIGDNGNYDLSGTTATLNAVVPLGKHHAWFRVEDGCGNYDICEFDFTVKDCKKPTPVCINGLSTDIMLSGMVSVWAKDFNASSVDNCTPADKLKYSFSADTTDKSIIYTCDSLGSRAVTIWVTDEAGNQDFCSTFILITDNMGVCGDTIGMKMIAGNIITEKGAKVGEVQVQLAGSTTPAFTTNATGTYTFPSMSPGGNYTVVPVKDKDPLNGVSTIDLVSITNHILGKKSLDSPYKMIAADANNNGSITTGDLSEIRKLILHINTKFSKTTSWRFIDKNFKFTDPKNPWKTALPEVYNISNLNTNMNIDFVGIKVGDVSGDVKANAAAKNEVRNNAGTLNFMVDDQLMQKGLTYKIAVKAKDFTNTIGYQYTLDYNRDALEFAGVEGADLNGISEENFGLTHLEEGMITSSWNGPVTTITDGTPLFVLSFKAKSDVRLSKAIQLSSALTPAEAYNKDAEMMDVQMLFNNEKGLVDNTFELLQNIPNPFNEFTNIGFNLAADEYAQLVITDMAGKVVKMVDGEFSKGLNQIRISKSDLGSSGIYYYQLNTAEASQTKKMIIIE